MAFVQAASRRLDFEQSRDGSATGSKQPANVPIDFPTGSGNLKLAIFSRALPLIEMVQRFLESSTSLHL